MAFLGVLGGMLVLPSRRLPGVSCERAAHRGVARELRVPRFSSSRGSGFSLQRLLLIFTGSRRDCLRVGIEVFWQNFGHLRNRPRLRRCGFLAKIEAKCNCTSCIDASEITPYAFCGVLFIPCFDHSIPRHDKSSARKRMQKRPCHILRPPYPEHLHEGVLTSPLMTR